MTEMGRVSSVLSLTDTRSDMFLVRNSPWETDCIDIAGSRLKSLPNVDMRQSKGVSPARSAWCVYQLSDCYTTRIRRRKEDR